jgi:hypothetical protein
MHSSTPFRQTKQAGDLAFSLADDQLQTVMLAASPLPPERRCLFLERVAARLRLCGPCFTDHDLDQAVRLALKGLIRESAA